MGIVAALSHLSPVEESINHVILLIGLAVGVDYALFYLRRVREERAAGRSKEAAIEAAAATSGRAVLISGITGHDRHGGHVLRRSADVHLVRDRHHRRWSQSRCSVAHGASRPAVDARRPHREGPGSRPRPAPQPRWPAWASGRGSWTGCSGARCCRRASPPACSWPWRSPPSAWTSARPTPRHRCRRTSRSSDVQPRPGGVPAETSSPDGRRQGQGRDGARR